MSEQSYGVHLRDLELWVKARRNGYWSVVLGICCMSFKRRGQTNLRQFWWCWPLISYETPPDLLRQAQAQLVQATADGDLVAVGIDEPQAPPGKPVQLRRGAVGHLV